MARKLETALGDFLCSVREAERLAADADRWSIAPAGARPLITSKRRDSMIEIAFLRMFLAWEVFIEQSFVLYVMGAKPLRGRSLQRFVFPPTRSKAEEWLTDGRDYATWGSAAAVGQRAERYFRDGRPFAEILRANQNFLDETRFIRNAIAHRSGDAFERFEVLVRNRLGALPANTTVGSFLATAVPVSAPPQAFWEFYLLKLTQLAESIVRPR